MLRPGADSRGGGARKGWGHSPLFSSSRVAGEPEAGGDYVKVSGAKQETPDGSRPAP